MEIVINGCWGGFGLSLLAEYEYLKRKGKKAYFYANLLSEAQKFDYKNRPLHRINPRKYNKEDIFITYTLIDTDLGEIADKEKFNKVYNDRENIKSFSDRDIDRSDKDLIAVVKKLKGKANGRHANLQIVKIPNGIEWEISEYDGMERIEEKHKVWS